MTRRNGLTAPGPPNSRHGLASFAFALFVIGLNAVLFTVLALVRWAATSPGPVLQFAVAIGGVNFFAWLGSFAALVMGIVGLAERDSKKNLAAWGVALNGLFFLGMLTAFVLTL
jgi:hypothetical protein